MLYVTWEFVRNSFTQFFVLVNFRSLCNLRLIYDYDEQRMMKQKLLFEQIK